MAAEVNVAFWNVQNLFEPEAVRGPDTQAELDAKIGVLADITNSMFNGQGPDLLGLAEVHTRSVFDHLAEHMDGPFRRLWEPASRFDHTGLGILARQSIFSDLTLLEVQRPDGVGNARPRSLIASCRLRGSSSSFLFVVNHWKSRRGLPSETDADRRETANWLGTYLAETSPIECALVIGDFNAEPFEAPFHGKLRGRRTFRGAFSPGSAANLYNTAWRFLAEEALWEDANVDEYQEHRPTSSHGDSGDALFDHLLVAKRALRDGPLALREKTVQFVCNPTTARRNRFGVLRPRGWTFNADGSHEGSSDHFPLIASFQVPP